MDTDAIYSAIASRIVSSKRGYHEDAEFYQDEIKRLLNEADEEHKSLLAKNERLVDENAELKSKLTEKASLLRGCYAADHKQKQRIEELTAELERIKALEPVALDHIACICDGELRYMSGRCAPVHDCELYAMPEGKAAPALYALGSKT